MLNVLRTFAVLFALSAGMLEAADNWPQFRGADSRGVAAGSQLPSKWSSTENVHWVVETAGRGWSSPIVWGNQIFLTTVVSESEAEEPKKGLYFGGNRSDVPEAKHKWEVICRDLETGEVVWQRTASEGRPATSLHIKNSYASETPVTDGERLYAYFGNRGLYCYSLDGEKLWEKDFEPVETRHDWGTAASPVLHGDRLFIVNDNEDQSWVAAFDKVTGDEIWRVNREEGSNWATPYVWENSQRTELVTPGTQKTRSYSLDGELLWELGGFSSITISTPYAVDDLLYVSSGYVLDDKKPILAIRPGASGDISLSAEETENQWVAWLQKQAAPYNTTTLVYDGLLYVLLDRGFFSCYDAKTGEEVYGKQRLPNGKAFTCSPWAYDGKVFCLNEDGVTFVIGAGREYELLHTNELAPDDMCMATPAIVGDKMLIRTTSRLYCLDSEK